jgi:hypothetical protein
MNVIFAGRLISAALLLLSLQLHAAEPLIVRTAISPESDVWVGQQVRLQLDLLALDGWAESSRLPHFEVDGAYLLRVESQGTRLSETLAGLSYSGQRYEWLLYPRRAGKIRIPPARLEARVKSFGADGGTEAASWTTPELTLEARLPPGAEHLQEGLISTTEMTFTQSWEPTQTTLRAGDGLRRTVSFRAAAIPAMAFTPMEAESLPHVAVYRGEPAVEDVVNRGVLEYGRRIESITYVPARAGEYRLPDISLSWWDIGSKQLRSENLPGITLSVTSASGADAGAPGDVLAGWKWLLAATALLTALYFTTRRWLLPRWRELRAARGDSEAAWFRRFVKIARRGSATETMAALMQWLDRLRLPQRPASLQHFMQQYGDVPGRAHSERFTEAFLGSGADWNAAELVKAMRRARRALHARQQADRDARQRHALRPLNP